MLKIFFWLLYLNLIKENESAKILGVFPVPSISHQIVFRPLIQELVKRGHELVVITPNPAFAKGQAPVNLTEIDVHDISYKIWNDNIVSKGVTGTKEMLEIVNVIVDTQLQEENVKKLIGDKTKQFDILLIEACARPALLYSLIYKVPVIQVSSFGGLVFHYESFGSPTHPMLYPTVTRKRLKNLSVLEKIIEVYNHYDVERILSNSQAAEDAVIKKHFGPTAPTTSELSNNVHMIFFNVHPIFEIVRPVTPSIVYIGGINQKEDGELPQDLKSYLDSSRNGVIYVSFGTNVDPTLLPSDKIQTLVSVFSKLPYDVLWKWNGDELPGRTENIKISKWLPQSDLLKHPKIKLFITQGGLQSTDEAITAGVPLIGIPMLGDQWYNVEKYVLHKIGARVDMETIDEESFMETIQTIVGDDSYRQNMVKLRALIYDQPQKPLERAVWWVEYVLRHGGAPHLRGPAANITWWDYLEIDLVLTVLGLSLAAILLLASIVFYVIGYIYRNYVMLLKKKKA